MDTQIIYMTCYPQKGKGYLWTSVNVPWYGEHENRDALPAKSWMIASPSLGLVVVSICVYTSTHAHLRKVSVWRIVNNTFQVVGVTEGFQACRRLWGDHDIPPAFLGPASPIVVTTSGYKTCSLQFVDVLQLRPLAAFASQDPLCGDYVTDLAASATSIVILGLCNDPDVCIRVVDLCGVVKCVAGSTVLAFPPKSVSGVLFYPWNNPATDDDAAADSTFPVINPALLPFVDIPPHWGILDPDTSLTLNGAFDCTDEYGNDAVKVHVSCPEGSRIVRHDTITVLKSGIAQEDPVNLVTLKQPCRNGCMEETLFRACLLPDGGLLVPPCVSLFGRVNVVPPPTGPGVLMCMGEREYPAETAFVIEGPTRGSLDKPWLMIGAVPCAGFGLVICDIFTLPGSRYMYGAQLTLQQTESQAAQGRMSLLRVGWMVAVFRAFFPPEIPIAVSEAYGGDVTSCARGAAANL